MEHCLCQRTADALPIVAIMAIRDAMAVTDQHPDVMPVAVDPSGQWAAIPICHRCHQAARLKAHYFMRQDAQLALRLTNMPTLVFPRVEQPQP